MESAETPPVGDDDEHVEPFPQLKVGGLTPEDEDDDDDPDQEVGGPIAGANEPDILTSRDDSENDSRESAQRVEADPPLEAAGAAVPATAEVAEGRAEEQKAEEDPLPEVPPDALPVSSSSEPPVPPEDLPPALEPKEEAGRLRSVSQESPRPAPPSHATEGALEESTAVLQPGARVILQGGPECVGDYDGHAGVIQEFHAAELAYTVHLDPQGPHHTVLKVSCRNVTEEKVAEVPREERLSLALPVHDDVQEGSDVAQDRTRHSLQSVGRSSRQSVDTLNDLHIAEGSILGRVLLIYCSQVAKRPKRLLSFYVLCVLVPLVIGILFRGFDLETDFNAFIKADGSAMRDREAYTLAFEEKKDLSAGRRLQVDEWIEEVEVEDLEGVRRLHEENHTAPGRRLRTLFLRKELQLLYRARNGNILSEKALQEVQQIEEGFRNLPGVREMCYTRITSDSKRFLCDPGVSVIAMAFPTQSSASQGRAFLEFTWNGLGRDLLPPAAILTYMKVAADRGDPSRISRRYFPKTWEYPAIGEYQDDPETMPEAARTKFSFHLTLGQNGDPIAQVNSMISKTKTEWNELINNEMLPYFKELQSKDSDQALQEVDFFYASLDIDSIEINGTLFSDLLMAIGSIAFVIFYLRVHTGTWLVSISAFLIIFISVPLAYIMTPAAKATIASFLSVFLITGIGCDVVFVFTDFWEQGHKLPMESRVMWMIVHAGESCLATSMTTALSFFANLASALQPLREFGMFMGLCVMCAFFLVLLMIPPLLVAVERRKEMVKLRVVDISSGQGVAALEDQNKKKKKDGAMQALLFHLMNGIARCPCMVLLTTLVFFITAAVGVVATAKLSTGVPDIFPPTHNQVAHKEVLDLFSTEANLQYPVPASGLICKADTMNGTDTTNCELHWCEAIASGWMTTTVEPSAVSNSITCWRSPTLKTENSIKVSSGYSTEGCSDIRVFARVAMDQISSAALSRTLRTALEDEFGPAGFSGLPPSVSGLRPLVIEKWETGTVEAVNFWQAQAFTASGPFSKQAGNSTEAQQCELHVLCFKETGYQCEKSGWKRLGSDSYALSRRLDTVVPRRLQGDLGQLVTQTVPSPVDVTVVWGIRSARSTPLVGPPSEFWSFDPNFVPQNPWAQRAISNMCKGLTTNLQVFRARCWIANFEQYLNNQRKRFPSRTFDADVINYYHANTVEAQSHLWFEDRRVIACKLQFIVNVPVTVASSTGLLFMKEWDKFVNAKNAVASITANQAWHTASIWVRSEAEKAIIGSTIDTIIIATCSGWAGVFLFTGDVWLAVIVTCVVVVVITGLAFYISCLMAWSIGPIEVISLVIFVGYSVTYALHIAHNYNQMRASDSDLLEAEAKVRRRKLARAKAQAARKRAQAGDEADLEDLQVGVELDMPEQALEEITFTPAQLREARTRVAVLHVGGATLSSALSTAGSSAFLLLCTLTIFVKLGGVVVAVTVLSIVGAIVTLPAFLMLIGPAPDAWYKRKVRQLLRMLMGGKKDDQDSRPLLDDGSPDKEPSELY